MTSATRSVWVINLEDEPDGLYVFDNESSAILCAERFSFGRAVPIAVSEEPVLDDDAAMEIIGVLADDE